MALISYKFNLFRSIVIDYLRIRPRLGIPVFFYFSNEESAENQSLSRLMSSFIKQLVIWTGRMPTSLQKAYNLRSRPDGSMLFNIFKEYCQDLSANVYVLLDGFDECQSAHYQKVISLIHNLNESGIRVYITMRDFLLKSGLFIEFDMKVLGIRADDGDVKRFVEFELKKQRPSMADDLQAAIIQKVTSGIDGMYPL
jgi:hypothetical protein